MSRQAALVMMATFVHIYTLSSVKAPAREIEDVRRAWLSRQDKIESALFEWDESRLYTAGSQFSIKERSKTFPDLDTTVELKASLSVSGSGRIKYSQHGATWDPVVSAFVDREYTMAFNGTTAKIYYGADSQADTDPLGFEENEHPDGDSVFLLPLLISVRPFHRDVSPITPRSSLKLDAGEIDNAKCDVLLTPASSGRFECEYWVDPSKDFIVRRIIKRVQKRTIRQIDIKYEEDNVVGWLPGEWTVLLINEEGALSESVRASVQKRLINTGLSDDNFEFDFPENTWVTDRTGGEIASYIQRASNQRRPVADEEARASVPYDRLVATEGPHETVSRLANARWGASRRILFYVTLLIVIALLCLTLWKRRHMLGQ